MLKSHSEPFALMGGLGEFGGQSQDPPAKRAGCTEQHRRRKMWVFLMEKEACVLFLVSADSAKCF
jgi:hypothetical protein